MLNDDQQIELKGGEGNWITARVTINKDGMYHVAAIDQGENVRMTEDFFIEARKALAPTVKIDRPGHDAKVNPIEEVTVTVNADDDFGAERCGPALLRQRRPGKDRIAAQSKGRQDSGWQIPARARRL